VVDKHASSHVIGHVLIISRRSCVLLFAQVCVQLRPRAAAAGALDCVFASEASCLAVAENLLL
jgi:hypothetical protein